MEGVFKNRLTWLLAACVFVGLVAWLSPITGPFFLGVGLAYLLYPLVDHAEAWHLPRGVSSAFLVLIFLLLLTGFWLLFLPFLAQHLQELIHQSPTYIAAVVDVLENWVRSLSTSEKLARFFSGSDAVLVDTTKEALGAVVAYCWSFVSNVHLVGALLFYVLVTPFVLFYGLKDWHRLTHFALELIPQRARDSWAAFGRDLHLAIGTYLRGQLAVCVCMACYLGVGFYAVGVPQGWLLGVFTGFLTFLPYVGMFLGMLTVTLLTVVHTPSLWAFVILLGVFVGGQLLEAGVLVPFFIGRRVGIHPVWMLFAIFAAGFALGGWGVIVALPLVLFVRVSLAWSLRFYRATRFFRHEASDNA